MKLLATGRDGQIVSGLLERAALAPSVEVQTIGRPQLDLSRPETLCGHVARLSPDIVVSVAAYTAVDGAEDDQETAMTVNAVAPGILAEEAAALDIPIIHISTDYVFSGRKADAYVEEDEVDPLGVYGRSKLAGEQAVAQKNPRHVILRTAWVYSPFGRNFVKTMLRVAAEREAVSVVSDQYGNPTSAFDIADGILAVARALHSGNGQFGTFHLAGRGATTWAGFASHVFAVSRGSGGPWAQVNEIVTAEYPSRACRPANSRLSCAKFAAAYGMVTPHWRQSVSSVVRRLTGVPGRELDRRALAHKAYKAP